MQQLSCSIDMKSIPNVRLRVSPGRPGSVQFDWKSLGRRPASPLHAGYDESLTVPLLDLNDKPSSRIILNARGNVRRSEHINPKYD